MVVDGDGQWKDIEGDKDEEGGEGEGLPRGRRWGWS